MRGKIQKPINKEGKCYEKETILAEYTFNGKFFLGRN